MDTGLRRYDKTFAVMPMKTVCSLDEAPEGYF
jgi:hypothetical protein